MALLIKISLMIIKIPSMTKTLIQKNILSTMIAFLQEINIFNLAYQFLFGNLS